jgi:hypothetical protein
MSVLLDLLAMDADLQSWLRAASFKTVGTADSLQEAMERAVNLPAAFTIYDGSRSAGRLVQGSTKQLLDPLMFSVAFVFQSLVSPGAVHIAAYPGIKIGERALVMDPDRPKQGRTPATCLSPIRFVRDYFVSRMGPKVCYAAQFATKAEDFF